jgi:hypothetical protein
MGGVMSVPRPWPYAIVKEEKIILTINSSVSEAEYRFIMLYIVGAYTN